MNIPKQKCKIVIDYYFTIKASRKLYIEHRNKFLNHQAKYLLFCGWRRGKRRGRRGCAVVAQHSQLA